MNEYRIELTVTTWGADSAAEFRDAYDIFRRQLRQAGCTYEASIEDVPKRESDSWGLTQRASVRAGRPAISNTQGD